jgi:hypothetical protein
VCGAASAPGAANLGRLASRPGRPPFRAKRARRGPNADARPCDDAGLTRLPEISAECREEIDDAPVGISHLRIALAPECIPWFAVFSTASFREFSVQTVDFLRRFAAQGHRHAVPSRWRRPFRIERPDRVLGIECEPQTSRQHRLNVTMPHRIHLLGELQTEAAIEVGRSAQIGNNHADIKRRHAEIIARMRRREWSGVRWTEEDGEPGASTAVER